MSQIYWPIIAGGVGASSSFTHDPHFSSVVQLAHFQGTNGSATFTNSCSRGNLMNRGTGTASISTVQTPKWGTASLRCPTGPSNAISGATHADYNFSTNDWTVEFWVNPDTLNLDYNSVKIYFDMRNASVTAAWIPTIYAPNNSGSLNFFANGADRITGGNGVITAGTWQHIACCRASGTTRLFVNGVQKGSNFTDANTYVQNQICLGMAGNSGGECIGNFQDLRITNGFGRYTANFSAPAGQFPSA